MQYECIKFVANCGLCNYYHAISFKNLNLPFQVNMTNKFSGEDSYCFWVFSRRRRRRRHIHHIHHHHYYYC